MVKRSALPVSNKSETTSSLLIDNYRGTCKYMVKNTNTYLTVEANELDEECGRYLGFVRHRTDPLSSHECIVTLAILGKARPLSTSKANPSLPQRVEMHGY